MLPSTSLGQKIAIARKKINLSQAMLAQQVSISPQAVGKWERGESMPDITTLNRLAEILEVDLNYFSESFPANGVMPAEPESLAIPISEPINPSPKKRQDWNWYMSKGNWVDADFSGLKDLKDEFSASMIKNCQFLKTDLSGLTFKGNDISYCDFSNSDMRNSKILSTEISKCQFIHCSLIDLHFSQTEIHQCDFSEADFSGAEFVNSNFEKNSIHQAIWKHTSFKNTGLSNITFEGKMEHCAFENCSFKIVKFQQATLLNSFFKDNRKLNRVEFIDCQVDKITYAFLKNNGAKLDGITIIE